MVILIASYDTGKHQDTLLNKTRFKVFIKLSVFLINHKSLIKEIENDTNRKIYHVLGLEESVLSK